MTGAIMDAQIDLNPHQVDVALFAFKNPLNKGVLLADDVRWEAVKLLWLETFVRKLFFSCCVAKAPIAVA